MDFNTLSAFFIDGDVRGAIEYLGSFPELSELTSAYIKLFREEEYVKYDILPVLERILLEYQKYYRDVFYIRTDDAEASAKLMRALSLLLGVSDDEEKIAEKLSVIFEENGYHIKTGRTNGHYGPYVWKNTEKKEYEVELPEGKGSYTVNILSGFIMCSWMDYITFGRFGTRGWADEGGINCIEGRYDFESEAFTVSLLKHEAQHVMDMKRFPDITPAELEYRAKLVELIYSSDRNLILKFLGEADLTKNDDSHAYASAKLKENFGYTDGMSLDDVKKRAGELFSVSHETWSTYN